MQVHKQAVDPNLVRLADAFDVAAQNMTVAPALNETD